MVAYGIKWSEGLDPTINFIAAKATHLLERGEFVVCYMRILSLCSEASQLSIIGFKVRQHFVAGSKAQPGCNAHDA